MNLSKWALAGTTAALFALADTGACRADTAPAASAPPAPPPAATDARPAAAPARAAPDIVLYATADCPYCRQARAYLQARGLTWTERDIEASPAARAEWQARGGQGTPLLLVDGTAIQGFDRARLDAALAHYAP